MTKMPYIQKRKLADAMTANKAFQNAMRKRFKVNQDWFVTDVDCIPALEIDRFVSLDWILSQEDLAPFVAQTILML